MSTDNTRKDSEIQAAEGPADPELESLIAPQGYNADLVDEVATLETPAQQRKKAIRFLFYMFLLVAIGYWFCLPANLVIPDLPPSPYDLHERPLPPEDKFLSEAIPKNVGAFRLVDLREEQVFEDPYVGETVQQATYIDDIGNPVTVIMFKADSYINARRYLENYKKLLHNRTTITNWQEKLYIEENFIQWTAPDFADKIYGLAWNNGRYFISVTSPISKAQQTLAAEFPY